VVVRTDRQSPLHSPRATYGVQVLIPPFQSQQSQQRMRSTSTATLTAVMPATSTVLHANPYGTTANNVKRSIGPHTKSNTKDGWLQIHPLQQPHPLRENIRIQFRRRTLRRHRNPLHRLDFKQRTPRACHRQLPIPPLHETASRQNKLQSTCSLTSY
jgi:hypothetical protein